MRSKSSNVLLLRLIEDLKKKAYEEEAPIWRDIARRLSRPRSRRAEVNVGDIARYTKNKEVVVVPGRVLGAGSINHGVTTAALSFSARAREKITAAGGECLPLEELLEKNPRGSGVKIIG